MSTLVGTQRANRTNKDKNAKSTSVLGSQTPSATYKTDKQPAKIQVFEDQLRIAQILDNGRDTTNMATVKQLSEMTGRSEEDVVVALHDAKDDPHRAVEILLEGEGEQGEWVEQGKKKKRSNTLKSDKETHSNHQDADRIDERPDRLHERPEHDRFEAPSRRGRDRRSGGPIPRLVRIRGRGTNNFSGNRDREGGRINRDNRDRSSYSGERESQEKEADWDTDTTELREKRGDNERSAGRERGRGRGRGMGGGFGRRGGRGRQQRFERQNESGDVSFGTWTNETAESAEKENSNWGGESFDETWKEDWNEDTWTGTLEESKVFTPSQTKSQMESDLTSALSDSTNTIGQSVSVMPPVWHRLDVGSLFSKSAEFAKAPDFTKSSESGGDSFISQYNQQATESIKNSIGIGSSSRQNLPNLSTVTHSQPQHPSQPLSPLPLPQREIGQSVRGSLPSPIPSSILPSTSSSLGQQAQQQQQQRQRSQRSKLPPPSKIPSSAVEMPGHMMPQLDVQFGVDFGTDSREFGFGTGGGGGDNTTVTTSFSSATTANSVGIVNHLSQVSKPSADDTLQTSVMSSSAGSKSQQASIQVIDVSPSRPAVYPNSVYTTPTKSDSQSLVQSANKVSGDAVAFPSPSPDHKSSGLISSQRTTQSPSTLAQATNGFSAGTYSSHAGHKSTGLTTVSSASQTFPHTAAPTQSTATTYQNQYASQNQFTSSQGPHGAHSQFSSAGQSQFPSSQSQYPSAVSAGSSSAQNQYMAAQAPFQSSQGQFAAVQSGQNQFQGAGSQYGTYQSSSSSFQSQTGISSSSATPSVQSSLYQTSNQQSGSSYPSTSGSFHVRDSQSSSSLQPSSGSQSASGYQPQPAAVAPGLKAPSTQTNSSYSSQTYSTTQHPQNLQTSPLSNKLGDSLSKMSLKDSALDTRPATHYDHGSTATTTASMTSSISTSSISAVTSTVSAMTTPVATSSTLNSRVSSTLPVTSESKAPPNPPPGVPLINPQPYIMGQGIPPYYPFYGFEEMQMLQQRLPLQTGSYYDMSAFPPVPSTIAGRDQAALGSTPFTGAGSDNKQMNRVDAQSPNSSSQQQSSHSAPQQTLPFNIHYGYYLPGAAVLPGAAGFQFPPMYPMPPVTNAPAPHVPGTPAANQLPKTYGTHQAYASKGYEEISGTQDLPKPSYGGVQQQAKVAGGSRMSTRTGSTADMNAGGYTKSHTQGFDKQGFPGGTPPPFGLPLTSATQAGPLGAPAAPYGTPFLPMMPPQPHNQAILHHQLQQDSGASSGRGLQQPANQGKSGGTKSYNTYWTN
ncbi:ubiquitin-associated protein 2-like isoform X3 [Pomacea canaliculata]|uniref:ubiquitin-associated protein 2-like isoform X3 n=1 Tax=Pomacea canaliculata TaxID=400727 RepID=UPI000D725974|nr:ubiquitin-associated protein 2-like isoform X3 [Pomacea canaliculata]